MRNVGFIGITKILKYIKIEYTHKHTYIHTVYIYIYIYMDQITAPWLSISNKN